MISPIFPGLIQVAGIRNLAEARLVLDQGAHWLGFPLRLPVNSPDLRPDQAQEIIKFVGGQRCVLITYETKAQELADLCQFLGTAMVQLHASITASGLAHIRDHLPSTLLIKSYVVGQETLGPEAFAQAYTPYCDALITDTFDPKTGACGATGQTHDWSISAALVRAAPCPVMLAGGLTPHNVGAAIKKVRPAAVDVHSGVEDEQGHKDPSLVADFVQAAQAAWSGLHQS